MAFPTLPLVSPACQLLSLSNSGTLTPLSTVVRAIHASVGAASPQPSHAACSFGAATRSPVAWSKVISVPSQRVNLIRSPNE
jgi:hypothetical protein